MAKFAAVALGVVGAFGQDPQPAARYAKGFVRQPRNAVVPVATITDEMRSAAPSKLDYSGSATSAVKDQGYCGSCWAFSATEGIESAVYMLGIPPFLTLSTQQLVACDPNDGGCNGGDLPTAFDFIEKDGGMDSDDNYPDTSSEGGRSGSCKSHGHVVKVTNYQYAVAPCEGGSCGNQDEDGLKAALAKHGPLSVCVNANDWTADTHGILKKGSCSGSYNKLDHCVQLVGYDTTASTPYWIVKNSWGKSWANHGFIYLPMGENSCGIADEAMYVTAKMVSSSAVV